MKIAVLGAGCWGFCLAALLASKGHRVSVWLQDSQKAYTLQSARKHPHLPPIAIADSIIFTNDLAGVLEDANYVVEAVTAAGLRIVLQQCSDYFPQCPLIISSKGIEQDTGATLPDVAAEILTHSRCSAIAVISGPSFAVDVLKELPTSVVCAAHDFFFAQEVSSLFTKTSFRVYPNTDVKGVAYGGALKNVIAIACGIAHGLELGDSARAALMTRGLHEMRKLAVARGCHADTLNGLAGMGDLCVTCTSPVSRNFHFGTLLAKGLSSKMAQEQVKMVVEGCYTCVTAHQLSISANVPMPITESVYKILCLGLSPLEATKQLMQRAVKEEHL